MIAHGTAQDKAALVVEAVETIHGDAHLVKRRGGAAAVRATLPDGTELRMEWDGSGAFQYGSKSTIGGRRVRNVAEAVRIIATHHRRSRAKSAR